MTAPLSDRLQQLEEAVAAATYELEAMADEYGDDYGPLVLARALPDLIAAVRAGLALADAWDEIPTKTAQHYADRIRAALNLAGQGDDSGEVRR